MTDKEHIDAINAATVALNNAQDSARADGLRVDVNPALYLDRRNGHAFARAQYFLLPTVTRTLQ